MCWRRTGDRTSPPAGDPSSSPPRKKIQMHGQLQPKQLQLCVRWEDAACFNALVFFSRTCRSSCAVVRQVLEAKGAARLPPFGTGKLLRLWLRFMRNDRWRDAERFLIGNDFWWFINRFWSVSLFGFEFLINSILMNLENVKNRLLSFEIFFEYFWVLKKALKLRAKWLID